MVRTLAAAIVVGFVLAGCQHAPPQPAPAAPPPTPAPSVAEAREAQNKAIDALFYCVAQYVTDNITSSATAAELADASISHCNREIRTLDNANQHWYVAEMIASRVNMTMAGVDNFAKGTLKTDIDSAHGIALERAIALRKPAAH
jgi:hypothetical protein